MLGITTENNNEFNFADYNYSLFQEKMLNLAFLFFKQLFNALCTYLLLMICHL